MYKSLFVVFLFSSLAHAGTIDLTAGTLDEKQRDILSRDVHTFYGVLRACKEQVIADVFSLKRLEYLSVSNAALPDSLSLHAIFSGYDAAEPIHKELRIERSVFLRKEDLSGRETLIYNTKCTLVDKAQENR